VRLWRCSLDDESRIPAYESTLSGAESQRASRFGHPTLRNRYILGRGALRVILGGLLALPPRAVPIVRGRRGRPQLAGGEVDFNVSHTGEIAIVAAARSGRIGVDVERRDRAINAAGIARKFLSAGERQGLDPADAESTRRRVLRLWTCKEAMSKATGDALSAPFAEIDIDLADGPRLRDGPDPYRPQRWSLHYANAGPDCVATVALWRAPA
jgi:4'-phosphopantetheinyl transferase